MMTTASETAHETDAMRVPHRPRLIGIVSLDLIYLVLFLPFTALHTFFKMATAGKYRRSWWGKWGIGLARATREIRGPVIWVHAVSVGDTSLRLGIAEIMACSDVPTKVTINEYIEIAKKFGDHDSPGFINGILDKAAQDHDHISTRKRLDKSQ